MSTHGTYTIGQVAERSGFSASALRYYEQHGVIEPVARTDAGYRLYDDDSLARLEFIDRAKQLGCTLEEITDLAHLWEADDCGPVQARLHELVTAKLADAQRRSSELVQFAAQLQTAAANLGGVPVDGGCSDHCACFGGTTEPRRAEPVVLRDGAPEIACSLTAEDIPQRSEDWQAIVAHVHEREPLPDAPGVRLRFDPAVPITEVARLAVAEHGCCSFFAFTITVDQRGVALEVRAPADAAELVDAVFGVAA